MEVRHPYLFSIFIVLGVAKIIMWVFYLRLRADRNRPKLTRQERENPWIAGFY